MNAVVSNSMSGKNYEQALDGATERGITAVAVAIEGQAKLLPPIITGRLAGSITYATKKDRSHPTGGPDYAPDASDGVSAPASKWTAYVGTNVEYAPHVEYGARGKSPQPFLRKALDEYRGKAPRIIQDEVKKGLKDGK
jgi:HK97 gp10 family phage protein